MGKDIIRMKDKYIIYNDNFEILSFKSNINSYYYKSEINIPTVTKVGIDFSNVNELFLEILSMLNGCEIKFLNRKTEIKDIFNNENGKLKKSKLYNIRDYYLINKNFIEEELDRISMISQKMGFKPLFIPINNFNKQESYVDDSIMEAILEVENQYIKKIERKITC